jgi:hypothetical protein
MLDTYGAKYHTLKVPRKLVWRSGLGQVTLDVTIGGQALEFQVGGEFLLFGIGKALRAVCSGRAPRRLWAVVSCGLCMMACGIAAA